MAANPENMQTILLATITQLTGLTSSQFKHSLSGNSCRIERPDLEAYETVDSEIYEQIIRKFCEQQYFSAFEDMLIHKTADCGEQSLLLSILFKHNTAINEHYKIFFTSTIEANINHTFLLLVPRNHPLEYVQKIILDNEEKPSLKLPGIMLPCLNAIVADPWRNLVYQSILPGRHPLDYSTSVKINDMSFSLTDMDRSFLDLQGTCSNWTTSNQEEADKTGHPFSLFYHKSQRALEASTDEPVSAFTL